MNVSEIIGKGYRALGFAGPKLADPDNVDSEIRPSQLAARPAPAPESDKDLVDLTMTRFRQSSEGKRIHEREWLLCKAFEVGNQWVEWRTDTGRLESLIDPHDRFRSYVTVNKIRPITTKLKARATMSKPDASVGPLTDSPQDTGAAREARWVLDHYDALFDRQKQTRAWVDAALTLSTSFLKIVWDSKKPAWVPTLSPAPAPETAMFGAAPPPPTPGKALNPVGDIQEEVISSFEVYPDPKARSWDECSWLIHAKVRPLSYIQEKYGEAGFRVEGDTGADWSGYLEQRIDGIQGDLNRGSGTAAGKNSATVYEMWERPSARFPKGRLIRVAGGQLLTSGDWPYEKRDAFPFVPLGYQEKNQALWALNAVSDLVPLQRAYNNCVSRIQDRVNTDKPTVLVREGTEIGVGAYQSLRNYEKVYYTGEAPTYQAPPPVNSYWFTLLELLEGQMADISGVHEVSNGSVPPGVTAGNAIELLQQSDQTQMSEFVGNIESAQVQRANWEIALAAQFYREPRLIGIAEESPNAATRRPGVGGPAMPGAGPASPGLPQPSFGLPDAGAPTCLPGQPLPPQPLPGVQARTQAVMLTHLAQGGQARVVVTPGSATPKTPAAQAERILDLFRTGAFQQENLPALRAVTDLLNLDRSDVINDRIDELIERQAASQPDPGAIEQAKQQAAQEQLQTQLEHEAQMEGLKTSNAIDLAHATSQLRIQEMAAERQMGPSVTLAGKLDPTATVDAEEKAGLHGDLGGATAQAIKPVPPAPAGQKGTRST